MTKLHNDSRFDGHQSVCLFCFVRDLLGDKQEIWAYSPIEWARWFAKNFATPKDIERTES